MVPTLVPTHTSDMSFGSEAEVLNFLAGGGLDAVSMASSVVAMIDGPLPGTAASLVCSGLAAGPTAVALAGLGGGHGTVTEPVDGPDPWETEKTARELCDGPWLCCGAVAAVGGP